MWSPELHEILEDHLRLQPLYPYLPSRYVQATLIPALSLNAVDHPTSLAGLNIQSELSAFYHFCLWLFFLSFGWTEKMETTKTIDTFSSRHKQSYVGNILYWEIWYFQQLLERVIPVYYNLGLVVVAVIPIISNANIGTCWDLGMQGKEHEQSDRFLPTFQVHWPWGLPSNKVVYFR